MTAIRFGNITEGQRRRQPGGRWFFEENGIARRTEIWRCNTSDLFSLMPDRGSVHPDYPNMQLKTRNPVDVGVGLTEYTLEYSGIAGNELISPETSELPKPVYGLRRSQTTEPITTHPNWDAIVAAAGAANVKYDDSGLFLGIAKTATDASLVGVTDYLSFGAIFFKDYVSYSQPDLSGVGYIDTPPDGKAPTVGAGFNWLKVASDYTEEGPVFAVYEAWMLSARGGWNETIYGSGA